MRFDARRLVHGARLAVFALAAGVVLLAQAPPATAPTWARGIEGQRKADLGNGTFLNPIMAGDHPDPSILKDGDDFSTTRMGTHTIS